jgi:hypothetical protein
LTGQALELNLASARLFIDTFTTRIALLTIRKLSSQPRYHRYVDRVALGDGRQSLARGAPLDRFLPPVVGQLGFATSLRPLAWARFRPSPVRSWVNLRSNSAIAANSVEKAGLANWKSPKAPHRGCGMTRGHADARDQVEQLIFEQDYVE